MKVLFKALDDETRRRILDLLRERDLTAGQIAARFEISKPSISHHLSVLQSAELVRASREGQFIRYSINTSVLEEAIGWLVGLSSRKTEDAE